MTYDTPSEITREIDQHADSCVALTDQCCRDAIALAAALKKAAENEMPPARILQIIDSIRPEIATAVQAFRFHSRKIDELTEEDADTFGFFESEETTCAD